MKKLILFTFLTIFILKSTAQVNLIITEPSDYITCLGDSSFFSVDADVNFQFQWQMDNGTGFVNLVNDAFFDGVATGNLIIKNSQFILNNDFFRCIVTDNSNSDTTISAKLTVKSVISPINLKDTIINPYSAILSWKIVSTCIDSVEVSYRPINSVSWETFFTSKTNFQTEILANNTTYEWRLRTIYKNSYSPFTALETFSIPPCLPPTQFFVSDVSDKSAFLEWEDISFAYKVYYKSIDSLNWENKSTQFNILYLDNLEIDKDYEFYISSACTDSTYSFFSDTTNFKTEMFNLVENTHSYWQPDSTGYKYLFKGGNLHRWSKTSGSISTDFSKSKNGSGAIKWEVPAGTGYAWLDLNVEDINLLDCNLYITSSSDTSTMTGVQLLIKSKNNTTNYYIDNLFNYSSRGNYHSARDWHSKGGSVFHNLSSISNINVEDMKHISTIRIRLQRKVVNQTIWIDEIKYLQARGPAAIIHYNAARQSQDTLLTPWIIENNYPVNVDFTYDWSRDTISQKRGGISTTYQSLNRIKHLYDSLGNWSVSTHGSFYEYLPTLTYEQRMKLYSSRLFNSFGFRNVNWCFSIPTDVINPQIKKEIIDLNRFNSIRTQSYPRPNALPVDDLTMLKFYRPTSASAFLGQQAEGNRRTLSEMKTAIDKVNNIKGLMIFDFGHIVTQPSIDYNGSEFTMLEDAKAIIKYADSLGFSMLNFENLFSDSLYQQEISINHDYYLNYKTNSLDTLDLLNNDLKPINNTLDIISVGPTQYGNTTILANAKEVVYTSSYANVKDKFWYVASDGTRSDTAWVFIKTSCFDSIKIINNDTISCQQSLTLRADSISNASYSWSGPNGFNFVGFSPTIDNMNRINAGQYRLIVSALECPADTSFIDIIVNNFPTISNIISDSICGSGPITLSASSDRGNIKWYASENSQIEISDDLDYDLTTNTLTINNLISTSSFYVEAIDGSCSSERQEVIATINLPTSGIDTQVACDSYTWIDGNTYLADNNIATHVLINSIGCDSTVTLNLTINNSNFVTDTQFACDSYTWIDGNTYTASNNTATHVLTNRYGCDSTVTLNLTINNSNSGIDTQIACDSYTWIDGNTYTSSNSTATHILQNVQGCDSTVTLNLTINNSSTSIVDTHYACDTYTWIDGNTYTENNNTATFTYVNAVGCDSTFILNLILNKSGIDTQIACDSYTWIDGNTYLASNNIATHVLTNSHGCDSTVTLNLTINNSNFGTDTQIACDSYTWIDGNTYTASNNTATHVLTNVNGCDSTVTLNLTINNSNSGIDTQIACDSYTWIDGNTYTSNNSTATHILQNVQGCDSTVTLNLTINNSSTSIVETHYACDTYTWIDGNTYTENNNTATFTYVNAVGCDSTVILNLILNKSGIDIQIACDSYTWIDGNTYLASNNIATHVLTNSHGCDSTVTLNLTINNSNFGTDTQIACDSFTWIDGNTYTASNNTATHVLTNVNGCDSTVTLNLTINNSNSGIDTQIACDSYTWIDGNTYTSSNTTATHILQNIQGCDSTVTLNLTIKNSTTSIDTQIACGSYTWIDGNTYTESNNSATYHLSNLIGCDSIITLNLTINNTSIGTDSQFACDSYTWIDGNTYFSNNNTATHLLTNSYGCDSIITLNLTVYSSISADNPLNVEACGSYILPSLSVGNYFSGPLGTGTPYFAGNVISSSMVMYVYAENGVCNDENNFTITIFNCSKVRTIDCGKTLNKLSDQLMISGVLNATNYQLEAFDGTTTLTWTKGSGALGFKMSNFVGVKCNTSYLVRVRAFVSGAWQPYGPYCTITTPNSNFGIDTQTACNSYTWIDGNTYTANNSSATHVLKNINGCDSIVTLNLTIKNSSSGIDTHVACDSYTWIDGNTYTVSNNTATYLLTNAAGCDSIVTLNLTINSTTRIDTQFACDSYTWIDGNTYLSSNNTATQVLTNSYGCDSIITLNLTVYSSISADNPLNVESCGSYILPSLSVGNYFSGPLGTGTPYFAGNVISSSMVMYVYAENGVCNDENNFTITIFNCANVRTIDCGKTLNKLSDQLMISGVLNATNYQLEAFDGTTTLTWTKGSGALGFKMSNFDGVKCNTSYLVRVRAFVSGAWQPYGPYCTITTPNSNFGIDTQTACNSYTWIDGNTYTANNSSATHVLKNINGCDSIVTLNLTIKNSSSGIDTHVACDSYTWIDGNTYTVSNNTATYLLTNAAGCDSIVTLNLIIKNSSTGIDTQVACESYTWIDGNTYTESNNTATYLLTNIAGCDSLVTLNLTINSTINAENPVNVEACNSYILPILSVGNYFSGPLGTGTPYFAGNVISTSILMYVYAENGVCYDESNFTITIFNCSKVRAIDCGKSLVDITDQLMIDGVLNATNYQFEAFDGTNTLTWTKGSNSLGFKMSNFVGVKHNTVYQIRIRAFVSGVWQPYGPYCSITTPLTRVENKYCGNTLTLLSDQLMIFEAKDATNYQYQAFDGTNTLTWTKGSGLLGFKMSNFPNVKANTTYQVRVRAYIGGAWKAYGVYCSITTPRVAPTQCGITLLTMNDQLMIFGENGATNYQFEAYDGSNTLTWFKGSGLLGFKMSNFPNVLPNTTYQVRVRAFINGLWQSWGDYCSITTPNNLMKIKNEEEHTMEINTNENISKNLEVFPNPNNGDFILIGSFEGTFSIINELGQLIQTIQITKENNYMANVNGFVRGVYFIIGKFENELISQKLIVQ